MGVRAGEGREKDRIDSCHPIRVANKGVFDEQCKGLERSHRGGVPHRHRGRGAAVASDHDHRPRVRRGVHGRSSGIGDVQRAADRAADRDRGRDDPRRGRRRCVFARRQSADRGVVRRDAPRVEACDGHARQGRGQRDGRVLRARHPRGCRHGVRRPDVQPREPLPAQQPLVEHRALGRRARPGRSDDHHLGLCRRRDDRQRRGLRQRRKPALQLDERHLREPRQLAAPLPAGLRPLGRAQRQRLRL